jgi:hypothetical protein
MTTTSPNLSQPNDILADPAVTVVSVATAARLLGVARTTAHYAYQADGYITAGVPVLRIGRRVVVPTAALRRALGRQPLPGDHTD